MYTVQDCQEHWRKVLILPSLLTRADILALVLALRCSVDREKALHPFVLDTETSLFGSPGAIKRAISVLPSPVSVLAYSGTANWLSDCSSLGKVMVVDPVVNPEYDLAALPSHQDQWLRSEVLRKVRRRPLLTREDSLSELLREAHTVSLLELAWLQGLPPALRLTCPLLCYKTAQTLSHSPLPTLTLREPWKRLQPWPNRESILASLFSEFLLD